MKTPPGRASRLATATVSKTVELHRLGGSTPSPSASIGVWSIFRRVGEMQQKSRNCRKMDLTPSQRSRSVPLAERQRSRSSTPARRVRLPQGTSYMWSMQREEQEGSLNEIAVRPALPSPLHASSSTPHTRGSANGRLPVFEAGDEGSNPSPRTFGKAYVSRSASR